MSWRARNRAPTTGDAEEVDMDGSAPKRPRVEDPARFHAERSASLLDQIIAQSDKQCDVALRASNDIQDLAEGLQKSVKKQLAEAKRMPDAHDAKIRDLERQIAKVKEEKTEKAIQLTQSLTSRTKMQKEIATLKSTIVNQQAVVKTAQADKAKAEAALAPTANRLNNFNELGARIHNLVVVRIQDLCVQTEKYNAIDKNDVRGTARLEREFDDILDLLQKGWKHVEQQYMRDTHDGTFPDLVMTPVEDGNNTAMNEDGGVALEATNNHAAEAHDVTMEDEANGAVDGEHDNNAGEQRQSSESMFVAERQDGPLLSAGAIQRESSTPSHQSEGNEVEQQDGVEDDGAEDGGTPEMGSYAKGTSPWGLPKSLKRKSFNG